MYVYIFTHIYVNTLYQLVGILFSSEYYSLSCRVHFHGFCFLHYTRILQKFLIGFFIPTILHNKSLDCHFN